jgi:hypothetical protein
MEVSPLELAPLFIRFFAASVELDLVARVVTTALFAVDLSDHGGHAILILKIGMKWRGWPFCCPTMHMYSYGCLPADLVRVDPPFLGIALGGDDDLGHCEVKLCGPTVRYTGA